MLRDSRRSARFFIGLWIMNPFPLAAITLTGASPTEISREQVDTHEGARTVGLLGRRAFASITRTSNSYDVAGSASTVASALSGNLLLPLRVQDVAGRRCDIGGPVAFVRHPFDQAANTVADFERVGADHDFELQVVDLQCSSAGDDFAGSERSSTDRRVNTAVDNRNGTSTTIRFRNAVMSRFLVMLAQAFDRHGFLPR